MLNTIPLLFNQKSISFIEIPGVSYNFCPTPREFLINIFLVRGFWLLETQLWHFKSSTNDRSLIYIKEGTDACS